MVVGEICCCSKPSTLIHTREKLKKDADRIVRAVASGKNIGALI